MFTLTRELYGTEALYTSVTYVITLLCKLKIVFILEESAIS